MNRRRAVLLFAVVGSLSLSAQARIIAIRIDRVEPFAAGTRFGAVGAYERVAGVAGGGLDPADPHNAGIVNIDKAPLNSRGKVEYETEFYILRPLDVARGNKKI